MPDEVNSVNLNSLIQTLDKISENLKIFVSVKINKSMGSFVIKMDDGKVHTLDALPIEVFNFSKHYLQKKDILLLQLASLNDLLVFVEMLGNSVDFYEYYNLPLKSLNLIAYKNKLNEFYGDLGMFKATVFKSLLKTYLSN